MAIKLNKEAFRRAQELIKAGEVEHDHGLWQEHKATLNEEVRYLNNHFLKEYGLWFLGIDEGADKESRQKYDIPFGDFSVVHKDALEEAQEWAKTYGNKEIEDAVSQLLDMIDHAQA